MGFVEVRRRLAVPMGAKVNDIRVMVKPLAGGSIADYLATGCARPPGGAMNRDDPAGVVQRQLEAYNARDLRRSPRHFADDITIYRLPATQPAITGKAQVRDIVSPAVRVAQPPRGNPLAHRDGQQGDRPRAHRGHSRATARGRRGL
jgi:hypothetical protein